GQPIRQAPKACGKPCAAKVVAGPQNLDRSGHVVQVEAMPSLTAPTTSSGLDRIVAVVRTQPDRILKWVLGLHLVVWTALPIFVCPNLQRDLAEDLALGKEWQLGYWKHPPLPWWLADLAYRITGSVESVYVLGPLAAVICIYAVWRLARQVVS